MKLQQGDKNQGIFSKYGWFILVVSVFFIAFFIIQNINNRFWLHDYEVYYSAANSFINGGQVYGIPYGLSSGLYKYSPFALIVFTPFAILPFIVAKIIHFLLLSLCIITGIIISVRLSNKYFFENDERRSYNLMLFLTFLPLLPNVYTELHLGNINIILLFIFLMALRALLSGKEINAGLLITLGILIKPHFLVFIPLLLIRKKFRTSATIFAGLAAGTLLPALFTGISNNIFLQRSWMATMLLHNNSLISGQDTIYSWIYRSFVQYIFPNAVDHDKLFGFIVLFVVAIAFLCMIILHLKKENQAGSLPDLKKNNFIFEFIVMLAIVPNITVTDSEHFLLSVPLIAFIVTGFFRHRENIFIKLTGVVCLVLYGINIREVIGKVCSNWFTANGMLGLANLMLIAFGIFIYSKLQQNKILTGNKVPN